MSDRPNILLVFTDQQRFDMIRGVSSNFHVETPNMDFLAREGLVFENCCCTAPICSPSRATMMTGLYPSQAGMPGNLYAPCPPLMPTIPTIGNILRDSGYETLYHGKWHMGGHVQDYGFEKGEETTHDATALSLACRTWRDRDWLEHERPFLHVVSFINPHDHYFFDPDRRVEDYTRPWQNTNIDPDTVPDCVRKKMEDWPEAKWGEYVRFYGEQLQRADRDLGELLEQFNRGGFFGSSWIIFTADHGDMAGEHNIPFKGGFFYEGVLRVPLIIVPPMTRFIGQDRKGVFSHSIKPGRREGLCSLIDLAPTILDIAGIQKPGYMSGTSLLPLVREAQTEGHDYVFAEWHSPHSRMVRSRTHKYTRYLDGSEVLYDLENDPHETTNLAASEGHAEIKAKLRQQIEQHIAATRDPFYDLDRHEFIFNPSPYQQVGTNA